MNKFKLVLWIIILAIIALVIFQNEAFFLATQSLQINPWVVPAVKTPGLPVAVFFLIFFACGLLLAFFFGLPEKFRNRKAVKRLTAANAAQKDEIEKLNKEIDTLKGVVPATAEEDAPSEAAEGESEGKAKEPERQADETEI